MSAIPTVTLWKDGQNAVVNECDAPEWIANGWAAQPEPTPEAKRPKRGA